MAPVPPWILAAGEPLRSWLVVAHNEGIGAAELGRIAASDPLDGIAPRGTPINALSLDAQRMAVANGYAIAIARAGGNADRYLGHVRELRALERRLGWCLVNERCRPGKRPPGTVLGIWSEDVRRALLRMARPSPVSYRGRSQHLVKLTLALLGIVALVFLWRFSDGRTRS